MEVAYRKCLVGHELVDPDRGTSYKMIKGKIYTTKKEIKDGQVHFLSGVWAKVPKEWFGEAKNERI